MNQKEIEIDILGKGKDKAKVDENTTVAELKDMLALDADVQALNENKQELQNNSKASDAQSIYFVPNVEGGSW
jgi:sulfur carrier protein ThiS